MAEVLCQYVESIIINDFKLDFPIKNLNIQCVICIEKPEITIYNFIHRIFKYMIPLSPDIDGIIVYTVSLINNIRSKGLYLNNLNSHRLVLVCFMLASKIHDDMHYHNSVWSYIGGITLSNLHTMELFVLELLDYDLKVILPENKMISIVKSIY